MRYNARMESLVDKIVVLLGCVIALAIVQLGTPAIAALLIALSLSALCECAPERISLGIACAYCVAATLFPALCIGLPLFAYECARSRFAPMRVAWIVPLLASYPRVTLLLFCAAAVICCIAFVLAYRTSTLLRERNQYRVLRDGVREEALRLEKRNRELARELENARGTASPVVDAEQSYPSLVFANLTERELQIAAHVAEGMDNREIASVVYASEGTVRNHISSILQKTGLRNRTQIAIAYLQK